MATTQYLDKAGVQRLWEKICWQDSELLAKIEANSERIDEIISEEAKVEYGTVSYWNGQPDLVSESGVIYVYSDAKTIRNLPAPRVKIGDGITLLKNMFFIDEDIESAIQNLANNKVSCRMVETTLQFYTD